ncbi:hypothetical protein KJ780_00335 [Candidatus Micrarchaeota archaeon]|nr:hypothetical protein [Candidatus Micrarchaeota archaeon]
MNWITAITGVRMIKNKLKKPIISHEPKIMVSQDNPNSSEGSLLVGFLDDFAV